MTVFNKTYDIATPDGSDSPSEADDRMRETKAAIQERLAVEHRFALTGTEVKAADTGEHTDITCDSIVNAGTMTAGDDITLGAGANLLGSSTSSINIDDTFTVVGASGNVGISGTLDVAGDIDPTTYNTTNGGFLDEDDMASDADDKVASQQSVKAYADASPKAQAKVDNVGGATFGSGSESITMPNGMIMKMGQVAEVSNEGVVVFDTAFPNGVVSLTTGTITDGDSADGTTIRAFTKSGFTVDNDSAAVNGWYWTAIGF